MVIHLISGKIKSDCYYSDLDLGDFDKSLLDLIDRLTAEGKIKSKPFEPNSSFQKSKYDYTEAELFEKVDDIDFKINEDTCNKRVLAPDGNIYYCPGFIELKDPICKLEDFEESEFLQSLEDFYFKKIHICTSDSLEHVRRVCPVKHKCDKKMCYYLNKRITGENRFPFSVFCAIKELKHRGKANKEDADVLLLILNSLTKINEAVLSFATANPDLTIRNRANYLVREVNENIEMILKKIEGENNASP